MGRKENFGLARRGVPPKGHWASDCVFPLVRPIGCIVAQNGILCANDIPLKVSIEEGLARRGVPPKGHWAGIGFNPNKAIKETISKNHKTKGRHHQTNNQRTKRRTISQDNQRSFQTTTIPTPTRTPKSRGRLSQNAKFDTGNQGVK